MEVVAPAGVTPAPFALCPRYNILAVGMAPSAAARGDAAESGASRVDVLRLLQPSGDRDLGQTLRVDCVLQAPGLRRLAWSATPRNLDGDDDAATDYTKLVPVEKDMYPAGLLAGGFNDGAVRIWSPNPSLLCDLKELSVPRKPKPELILDKDPVINQTEKVKNSIIVSGMYSDIESINWSYSEDEGISLPSEEEGISDWEMINDAECFDWEIINRVKPVLDTKQMMLVTETHDLCGPVLGLSFSDLNPYWIATAAKSDNICVHDLQYPIQLSRIKHQFNDDLSHKRNSQITCLKWSKISPTILASTGDAGVTTIWDLRAPHPHRCLSAFTVHEKMCSSDLEFSWNNPMHLAVSTGASATVKIWDIRKMWNPLREYSSGDSGVLSLSWNRLGQLLASDTNGAISVYDVHKDKIWHGLELPHCDLGLTWSHSEDVAATLSSQNGVKLCRIGD